MAEIKTGYMHKCGKSVKSWKRRLFILKENGYLYYYENQQSKTEKGKIDVVDAVKVGEYHEIPTAEKKLPSGFSHSNAFAIVSRDRTYTCICENDGDNLSWLAAINKVRHADGDTQHYPQPTYSKEKTDQMSPIHIGEDKPPMPQPPPPYTAVDAYGGTLPHRRHSDQVPTQPTHYESKSLPSAARVRSQSVQDPVKNLPASNPYYSPPMKQPPGPQYQPQPPGPQYQPQPPGPQYQPQPPRPQYQPQPPRPQYQQRSQYPPPQPQYRAPPPQAQYQPRPPQPVYRPQPCAPPVGGPYLSCPQRPSPQRVPYQPPPQRMQYRPPPPQQMAYRPPAPMMTNSTNVTVINIGR